MTVETRGSGNTGPTYLYSKKLNTAGGKSTYKINLIYSLFLIKKQVMS
jgi:hypothetical protein